MMRKTLLTLAACLAAPVALAQGTVPERGPIPFEAYDRDGDGRVSQEEFYSARGERMSGRAEEGRAMRGHQNAPPFEQFDADGDGMLSRQELAAGQQAQRSQRGMQGRGMGRRGMGSGMRSGQQGMDRGGQQGMGRGGQQGMGRGGQQGMGRGGQQGMGRGGQQGMGRGGQQGMGRNQPAFSEFDLNGDGRVEREEFREARRQRMEQRQREGYPARNMGNAPDFEALDRDGDGVLDAQEFGQMPGRGRNQ